MELTYKAVQDLDITAIDIVAFMWNCNVIATLGCTIGIAIERGMAEILREELGKKLFVIPYWLSSEVAAAATDLAEYLGTVIACIFVEIILVSNFLSLVN